MKAKVRIPAVFKMRHGEAVNCTRHGIEVVVFSEVPRWATRLDGMYFHFHVVVGGKDGCAYTLTECERETLALRGDR